LERVLIIRLTALGDVLLATPLLRSLKLAQPEKEIDWLIDPALAPLLEGNPHLSRVLPFGRGVRSALRARHYDLVIDLQNKLKTAALLHALGARRILTLRKRNIWNALVSLLGHESPTSGPHAVDRNLELVRPLGVTPRGRELQLEVTESGRAEVAGLLANRLTAPVWGLAAGSRWATKRWPLDRYQALGGEAARSGAKILLLGGPTDAPILDALGRSLGSAALGDTRQLSIAGLVAAIDACDLVVSNDSGPAHIAAALGRPVVVLFGPTSPSRWAPPGRKVRVVSRELVCSPCSNHGGSVCPIGTHACLEGLEVRDVLMAARGLLAQARPDGGAP
jgi:heptosyltransferase-2